MKDRRKKTEGRKYGKIAFFISEAIIVLLVCAEMHVFLSKEGTLDGSLISGILTFQGMIFAVTWGATSWSGYTKKRYGNTTEDFPMPGNDIQQP